MSISTPGDVGRVLASGKPADLTGLAQTGVHGGTSLFTVHMTLIFLIGNTCRSRNKADNVLRDEMFQKMTALQGADTSLFNISVVLELLKY